MEVRKIRFPDGEDYSILLDRNKMPMAHSNLYLTIKHRNRTDSSNTCLSILERIKYLYEICDFLGINIEQRCREKSRLTKEEMQTLVRWAGRKVEFFREHVAQVKSKNVVALQPDKKKLETARAVIVPSDKGDCAPTTAYNRITTFAKYIGWLEGHFHLHIDDFTESYMLTLRPKKTSSYSMWSNEENYKSLTPNQIIRVLDIVRYDSSLNPWKNECVRYRNDLITNTLEALGLRRSELARIKLTDIRQAKNGKYAMRITQSIDRTDVRKNRPEAKTLGRTLPLDSRLVNQIHTYITDYRSQSFGADGIEFLFITHNHRERATRALSLQAINKIFNEVSDVSGFNVHPHAFRHSWNDKYSEYVDKLIDRGKTTEAQAEANRQKLMGWLPDSRMAQWYSKRYSDKRALIAGLELQEKGSAKISTIIGQYDDSDIDI